MHPISRQIPSDSWLNREFFPKRDRCALSVIAARGKRHFSRSPDGTCIRDYIHVSDIAEAHVLALKALEQSRGFTAYNLGNGRGFSVKEVIDATARIAGKAVPVAISGRRRGDPACLVSDAQRIQRDFGWTTRFPDLETIIATAWRWHRAKVSLPGGSDSLASAGGFGGD